MDMRGWELKGPVGKRIATLSISTFSFLDLFLFISIEVRGRREYQYCVNEDIDRWLVILPLSVPILTHFNWENTEQALVSLSQNQDSQTKQPVPHSTLSPHKNSTDYCQSPSRLITSKFQGIILWLAIWIIRWIASIKHVVYHYLGPASKERDIYRKKCKSIEFPSFLLYVRGIRGLGHSVEACNLSSWDHRQHRVVSPQHYRQLPRYNSVVKNGQSGIYHANQLHTSDWLEMRDTRSIPVHYNCRINLIDKHLKGREIRDVEFPNSRRRWTSETRANGSPAILFKGLEDCSAEEAGSTCYKDGSVWWGHGSTDDEGDLQVGRSLIALTDPALEIAWSSWVYI